MYDSLVVWLIFINHFTTRDKEVKNFRHCPKTLFFSFFFRRAKKYGISHELQGKMTV